MAGEWKRTSLREAGVTLIDCDHRTPPAADSGYPYVAIPQLKEGRIVLNDVRRISPEHFVEWTRKAKPQHHDVILSRRCNPGETAYVPAGLECALGQNLVLLRADGKKLFPPFLRWLVRGTDWGACASRVRPRASMPEGTTHSAQFARGQKWGRASCAVNPPHLLSYNL